MEITAPHLTTLPKLKLYPMEKILFNLALIDAGRFCKENGIDCSGTHLVKYPRKFTYALVQDETGKALVTTTFHKSQVPTHTLPPELLYPLIRK